MAPWWQRVLSFSLFTPESGVDSAEADKVGSREIRFCAYVGLVSYGGMRHYRATPGALILILTFFGGVCYCRLRQLPKSRSLPACRTSSFGIGGRSVTSRETNWARVASRD